VQKVKEFTTCAGCSLRSGNKCNWFEYPRIIPKDTFNKGCKYRKSRYAGYEPKGIVADIINIFKGELI
tara:strand:+ start:1865 stop:2068 length:204 start_codon:yes stop_codon:yes gene_type:complete